MKTIVVIGNGSMAADCLRIMRAHPQADVALVIADPEDLAFMFFQHFCKVEGFDLQATTNINASETVAKIRGLCPHLIFNINSFQIIKDELIAIPQRAIINFHNGPLPRYRGVNVCSWAILNNEKSYGVTWHILERRVDSGDIVAQRFFNVSRDETAFTLTRKCIREGTALFEEIFPRIVEGKISTTMQDQALATCYTRRDVPNDGFVNYSWTFEMFDRFVRGLSFKPIPNLFIHPKSVVKSVPFYIEKIVKYPGAINDGVQPGTILGLHEKGIDVKIKDSAITITEVLNSSLKRIRISAFIEEYNLAIGNQMEPCGTRDL